MILGKIALFTHTIKYLRFKQILYRIWYAVFPINSVLIRTSLNKIPDHIDWSPIKSFTNFLDYDWWDKDEITQGRFQFLNDITDFGNSIQWQLSEKSRLWLYNLQYFQYLFPSEKLNSTVALGIINNWINQNPPGAENAWDPYPISLRLVNWFKYLSTVSVSDKELQPILKSTYHQAFWLEHLLEYHLLGNHLFKNAKALAFSGLFFKGSDADRWLTNGLRVLNQEIGDQILQDGGHFERSPMYHTMILEDCLDLLNITHNCHQPAMTASRQKLEAAADRMISYLVGMSHPDGEIALFNDAAFGIEHSPEDLIQYYERVTGNEVSRPDGKLWSFSETGYYVMTPKTGDRMIIDCGLVGPDYQPGHCHCDTLSFELSLNGRRVIVDSGCFEYEDGPIRQYNRGNAGHNTVTIDGENQSEVWGAHRCARRARPVYANLGEREDGWLHFDGAHDGYKRLKGRPIHHRSVRWKGDFILIDDCIEGRGNHDIESRLHIHPDLAVETNQNSVVLKDNKNQYLSISVAGEGKITVEAGWYCPEFGLKYKCPVIVSRFKRETLPFKTGWKFVIK